MSQIAVTLTIAIPVPTTKKTGSITFPVPSAVNVCICWLNFELCRCGFGIEDNYNN